MAEKVLELHFLKPVYADYFYGVLNMHFMTSSESVAM